MRILFIVGTFPAISEPFIINQVAGVMERGHEALVYAVYGAPSVANLHHPLVVKHCMTAHTLNAPAIPRAWPARLASGAGLALRSLPRAPLQTLRLLNVRRYGWQAASLQLLHRGAGLIGQPPFDIIHCQFGTLGLLALALRREGLLRGPLVTTFRGHDISAFLRASGEHVYDELFRDGDYFLANCDFFRRRLVSMGCDPDRLDVLYSGIEVERFRYRGARAGANGRLNLLFIGRLVEKKGLRHLIDAVATLRTAGIRFRLTIGGDGPLRAVVQHQIDRLKLGGLVKMVGACPQSEVIRLLEDADIFISPSVTSADGDEDAPVNTLKEAMAIGLPVIATRHGGIPELVEDGVSGYLVPERNSRAIAEKVVQLANSRDAWEGMGRRGRARVEEAFSATRLNAQLIEIYNRTRHLPLRAAPRRGGTGSRRSAQPGDADDPPAALAGLVTESERRALPPTVM